MFLSCLEKVLIYLETFSTFGKKIPNKFGKSSNYLELFLNMFGNFSAFWKNFQIGLEFFRTFGNNSKWIRKFFQAFGKI